MPEKERRYPQFEQMLSDLDELLRLRRAMAAAQLGREAARYNGFSLFIDAVLPRDVEAEMRIARAVRIHEEALHQLRQRELGPADVPPESLAMLGRCTSLDWTTFDLLVSRDLKWFAEESPLAMLRDNTANPADVRESLRSAWQRDELDDASAVSAPGDE